MKNTKNYPQDKLGNIKALHLPEANEKNNLHVVEEFINGNTAHGFIYFLRNFVQGFVGSFEGSGYLLPECQMYDDDDNQILDCVEQVPGLEFFEGIGPFTDVMVSFEDAKRYFRMAAETHMELEPEYAERLEAMLQQAEAKLDQYAANRAAYLAEHPEQA